MTEIPLKGTALCVGAGTEQCPAIEIAQAMGLSVLAIDANPNAAGLTIADQGIVLDPKNISQTIQLAQNTNIRCVLPVPLGAILTTVGAVNDALGLQGISKAAAQRCIDKLLMHHVLTSAGLSTPHVQEATNEDEICKAVVDIGFPVILKPRFGSGSRGIFVARDFNELKQWLPWHMQQKRRWNSVESSLVEQFIDGVEVGVDSVIENSRHSVLLLRDKQITNLPFRLPYAHLAPSYLSQAQAQAVEQALTIAAQAIGLHNCLMHADVMISNEDEIIILDMSGRPSGFHLSAKMLPVATGIDAIRQGIYLYLGQATDFLPSRQQAVVFRMLSAPPGIFQGIKGLADVALMPGVVAVESFLKVSDRIQETRTGATGYRVGYLISSGETRDAAELAWHNAANKIEFQVSAV